MCAAEKMHLASQTKSIIITVMLMIMIIIIIMTNDEYYVSVFMVTCILWLYVENTNKFLSIFIISLSSGRTKEKNKYPTSTELISILTICE